jgi:hypothetical protein
MATNPSARIRRHESKFVLVWAGNDIATPGYGGMVAAIPPVDKIANPAAPNSPYRFPAAEDEDGPIPGSIALKSVIVPDHTTGGYRAEFDATDWCDGIETTEMGKGLLKRGMTILDGGATRADIEQAQTEGRPKWESAQEAQWNETLSRELQRQEKLTRANRPITSPTNQKAISEAIAGLETLRRSRAQQVVSQDTLRAALGFERPVSAATVTPFPAPVAVEPAKVADKSLDNLAESLLSIAQKHNVRLKNDEVMGLVKRDESVMMAVQTKLTEAGVNLEAEVTV